LLTRKARCIGTCRKNRKTGYRIFNDAYFAQAHFTRGQHNPVTFDFGVERITRPKAKFAPDWTRKNDLTFRGNLGFHGKTILRRRSSCRNAIRVMQVVLWKERLSNRRRNLLTQTGGTTRRGLKRIAELQETFKATQRALCRQSAPVPRRGTKELSEAQAA
jgi:hypothetical protein